MSRVVLAHAPRQRVPQLAGGVMRTKTKVGIGIGIALLGVSACFVGPTLMFLLFHSDWETVPHLLTVESPAEPLRIEVVDSAGQVVWAIEKRGGPSVHEVDYGVIPDGFVQLAPGAGPPRDISGDARLGMSYCDDKGGGAFVQVRVRRGAIQHGLAYWGRRNDGTLCDRRFIFTGWTAPKSEAGTTLK